jgi:RNA polymerase sigma factor (sigma-70 family)
MKQLSTGRYGLGIEYTSQRSNLLLMDRTVRDHVPLATTPHAFSRLAAQVRPRLIPVVRAIVASIGTHFAEDVVQTALVAVWKRWEKTGAPDNPHAYATTAAIRCAYRFIRAEQRLLTARITEDNELSASSDSSEIDVAGLRIDLDTAIQRQRAVLRQYLAGKSYTDIAEFSKISEGTVASQLHQARKALRIYLNGQATR